MVNDMLIKRYVEIDEQLKALEKEKDLLQAELRAAGANTYIMPLTETKVVVSEASAPTEINAAALGTWLIDHKRKNDFLNVAKVTVKDLDKLIDGSDLVREFGQPGKVGKPRVTVSAFSKDDRIIVAEQGPTALGHVIQG